MNREPSIRLTPLYSIAQRLGAQFTEPNGWRIPEVYTTLEAEIAAARRGVALADETSNGKVLLQGVQVEAVLQEAFDLPTLAIGAGVTIRGGEEERKDTHHSPLHVYRLRNDRFFISTPPGGEDAALEKLTETMRASGHFVTVTDVTHGRTEIRAIGPASRELLSKVCGLDFHPSAFPNSGAKQSSLAKTTQLIIRRDISELPAFSIIGARSLGAYVWDTIMDAGREFGLAPIGWAAIRALKENNGSAHTFR
ncbi:aminomethyl transferase family protein [Candidatus Poribacteria bacterium]|nr:aminomethyl transferase family protein [Candidatus Poribacteria bacterium]